METTLLVPSKLTVHRKLMLFEFPGITKKMNVVSQKRLPTVFHKNEIASGKQSKTEHQIQTP